MQRSLQGLLFLGVALFALKWEFHGSRDQPASIAPTGEAIYTAKAFFEPSPPWGQAAEKVAEASVIAFIGLYILLTGEVTRLRGQTWRYSSLTYLAAVSVLLAVFTTKSAWHSGDPMGFYPPFDQGRLLFVYGFFVL